MILSILICSLDERADVLTALIQDLKKQTAGLPVEVLVEVDNREISTGEKRNRLLARATGTYVVFVDDDDELMPDYVAEIIKATKSCPDVIGFEGIITVNNGRPTKWKVSKDLPYKTKRNLFGKIIYLRFNNHLSPIKRKIALQIGYKDITWQEDLDYATRLKDSGLIKTEVYIPKNLYHYKYVEK